MRSLPAVQLQIAYETVDVNGTLPLLAPMSEVAGRLATQVGATALERVNGGRGVLLGGVPGVAPGRVLIIGGGVAGLNAAVIAMGMGADVTVLDHVRLPARPGRALAAGGAERVGRAARLCGRALRHG